MINRSIQPNMPASEYKTYQIVRPRATHFRTASCQEVQCPNYLCGWKTILPVGSGLVEVARRSGRKYVETKVSDGLIEFVFQSGQNCFTTHQVSLDKPEIYVVRDGDFRGNPRGTEAKIHANGADWVDDFANHQDKVKTLLERG